MAMKHAERVDCSVCGKKQLSKDEIGINRKMLGREIKSFFCLSCLAEYLDVSIEELIEKIEEFKEQGCTLF
jgi:uncharacterized protein YlaI